MLKRILQMMLVLTVVSSCQVITSFIHDDKLVAKVGRHRLYQSQVQKYIPAGASSADSANIASKYIYSWANEMIFNDMASKQLSKAEQDVASDIESYKRSLLRYRYEQSYIDEMLDTTVTAAEIEEYHASHAGVFALERPVLKVRFLDIMQDSPNLDILVQKMSSSEGSDLEEADSLANQSAFKYFDSSDTWMDAAVLAREFGIDYGTMLSNLKGKYIEIQHPERGDVTIAYVCDIRRTGEIAPLDYCSDNIRDIILQKRRRDLISGLEQDLLTEALRNKKFVIY